MKNLFRAIAAFMLLSLCLPATAQTAYNRSIPTTDTNPAPSKTVCWSGSAYVACGLQGGLSTYRAIFSYPGYTSATDTVAVCGSATAGRKVRVTSFAFQAHSTSATIVAYTIVRRSTADTGGTSTNPALIPLNSASPAATATVTAYTAAPTLGTLVGTMQYIETLTVVATATPSIFGTNLAPTAPNQSMDFRDGLILNGATECLAFNAGGVSSPAGYAAMVTVELVEY
jgi:hypothetical protein